MKKQLLSLFLVFTLLLSLLPLTALRSDAAETSPVYMGEALPRHQSDLSGANAQINNTHPAELGISTVQAGSTPGGITALPSDPAANLPIGSVSSLRQLMNASSFLQKLHKAWSLPAFAASEKAAPLFSDERLAAPDSARALEPISDEAFDKLLAEQEAPSAEYFESLILNREARGELQHVEISFSPVRYKTENGEWAMIDPSVQVSANRDGSRSIRSAASSVRVNFHESAAGSGLVSMEKDGRVIAFAPVSENTARRQEPYSLRFVGNDGESCTTAEALRKEQSFSGILYQNVFAKDTALVYTPTGDGVKEDIVLYAAPQQKEYSFLLYAGELSPVLREDGRVYLVEPKTRQIAAMLTAPYMYDSSAENEEPASSRSIRVRLCDQGDGTWLYTLTPDEEWLRDSARVYPVHIDPTATYNTGSWIGDTYVDTIDRDATYHSELKLKCGHDKPGNLYRDYFDLSAAVAQLTQNPVAISKASLVLYEDYEGASYPYLQLHQVTSQVVFSELTWNKQPTFESSYFTRVQVTKPGFYTWNMTEQLKKWINDPSMPRMCMLKIEKEENNQYKRFYPLEISDANKRPKFVVEYTTIPNAPASASLSSSVNSSDSTKLDLKASWSSVSEANGYIAALYEYVNGSWTKKLENTVTGTGCTFSKQNDASQFFVRVWAKNNVGPSAGYVESSRLSTPDRTAPGAISSVTVSPTGWTKGSITITHSAASDKSSVRYQYVLSTSATSKPADSAYKDLPSSAALTHSVTPTATTGAGYVWVRAVDANNNKGQPTCSSNTYKFCNTAPSFSSFSVTPAETAGSYTIDGVFSTSTNNTADWNVKYHVGTGSATNAVQIASGRSTQGHVQGSWTYELADNTVYTFTMTLTDLAGNTSSKSVTLIKADGSRRFPARLKLNGLAPKNNGSAWNVWKASYGKLNASDTASYSDARLIVDNERMAGLEYTVPLTTPEGQVKYAYVMAKDQSGEPAYSYDSYEKQRVFLSAGIQSGLSVGSGLSLSNGTVTGSGTLMTPVEELPGTVSFVDLFVNENKPSGASISYQVSLNGGSSWTAITPVSTDGGVTVNYSNRLYVFGSATGSKVKIKAVLSKGSAASAPSVSAISASVRYLFYGSGEVIKASFVPNARDITSLSNTNVTESGLTIKSGSTQGYVLSTARKLSANAVSSRLIVDATIPSGAKIQYYLSTNGGSSWQSIQTVPAGDQSTYNNIGTPGANLVLKAVLTANSSGASPVLRSWSLEVKTTLPGTAQEVVLIDPPDNLSTLTPANNMTLLRWSPSETEGVVYNVYRSETPYFVPAAGNLAAQGLTGCYWYDYNLNFGHSYYYFVAAEKDGRLSLSSKLAFGTAVAADEFNKRLGLQSYWSFAQFDTSSGAGYVNVSNGNLVYQTTDFVVSDPFFAMVMRRTYNSQASSKTALGAGWDFSFNTTLMREYNGSSETAMVLKDGDGSLHRFTRNSGGSYKSAPGTRMSLVHDTANGEYVITRKDNVLYHFDDQSLQLTRFTNLGGAELNFEYDLRGNLVRAVNSVGDSVELSYVALRADSEEAGSGDSDYCWVNEHVDMLSSAVWTSKEGSASIRYDYEYDANDRLVKASTTNENGTKYCETFSYGSGGMLSTITNPDGGKYTLSFDSQGRCTKLVYPSSVETNLFEYGSGVTTVKAQINTDTPFTVGSYTFNTTTGVVTKTTDAKGHVINYAFTSDLLLQSVSYTNYVKGVLNSQLIKQEFTYDSSTRDLTRCAVSYNGSVLSDTRYESYLYNQPRTVKVLNNGSWLSTSYTYNTAGQVLTAKDPSGKTTTSTYNNKGYLSSVQDRNGGYTFYDYDAMGRVVAVSASNTSSKSGAFSVVRYTYDAYGRTATTATDGMNDTTSYAWYKDARGLLKSVTYANGAKESYSYTKGNLLAKAVDVNGVSTSYGYSAMRVTKQTVTAGDYSGVTAYAYGGKSAYGVRQITVTDPEGRSSTVWYDASGLAVRQQSGGVVTENRYDLMGRPTVSLVAYTADYKYARLTRVEYDALGNQTLSAAVAMANMPLVGANGEKLSGYDLSKDIVCTQTFDQLGNVLTATDGAGVTTSYQYDALSRLTKVTQPLSAGQNAVTTYQYDVVSGSNIKNITTSAKGVKTESVFDKSGRLLSQTAAGTATTSYVYNAKGQTTKLTRPDNSYVAFTYDRMGNLLTEKYYAAGASSPALSSTYTYNSKGTQLLSVSQTGGGSTSTLSYSYDALGRMVQQSQETGAGAGSLQINYRYNKVGQVTAVAYPVKSGPNGASELSILRYVYNGNGQLDKIYLDSGSADSDALSANAKLVRSYSYNINGQTLKVLDNLSFLEGGNQNSGLWFTYDSFGRNTRRYYADVVNGVNTAKEDAKYTYDKRGNILTENVTTYYGTEKLTQKSYEYDLSGRMIKAVTDGKTTTYSYDAVGNRLTRTTDGTTSNYTYDNLNRLTKITAGSETTSFSYDARGNQLKEVTVNGSTTITKSYSYDLADRLSGYTCDAKQGSASARLNTSSYGYNPLGQRVTRVENDVTTHFYYTGSALLYTTENEYLLKTQNILTPGGSIVASKRFEGATHEQSYADQYFFYRYDIRGSVTNIVDGAGAVVKSYDYDEFGNTTASDSGFHNDVTFTGSVADASGLQYMNARYYNPQTARFLSQDTYTGTASEPWTQHLYAYCNNNPVNMVDPTGHIAVCVNVADGGGKKSDPVEDDPNGRSATSNSDNDNKHDGDDGLTTNDGSSNSNKWGPNSPLIDYLFGSKNQRPEGAMYFLEFTKSFGEIINYVRGETVVFDENKYCVYEFSGISVSYSALPIGFTQTQGYVYGVNDVNDFSGFFSGRSSSFGALCTGKEYAPNGVYSEVVGGAELIPAGSIGVVSVWYWTTQTDWIEGSYPWKPNEEGNRMYHRLNRPSGGIA